LLHVEDISHSERGKSRKKGEKKRRALKIDSGS